MLRYHLLCHKCNIIISIISITADIAQPAFKEKDLRLFYSTAHIGLFVVLWMTTMQGLAVSTILLLFSVTHDAEQILIVWTIML